MIPVSVNCGYCGSPVEVRTYRKFIKCPYCGMNTPFEGFEYEQVDWSSSMYSHVKLWSDCPACRSKNMYLGPSGRTWKCPDCGYSISRLKMQTGVFWFCDECEAFLNIQPGFSTREKTWKCTECGHVSGVSKKDII